MIRIEVVFDDQGVVKVNGDLNNLIVTLGLLEAAKVIVQNMHVKQSERLVQPARVMPS